jgi:uncharacterized membrane protein
MWWWTDGWGSWLVMLVFVAICVVVMGRMMRGMGRKRSMGMCGMGGHGSHRDPDAADLILDERLARGEIDVREHGRLREVLTRTGSGSTTEPEPHR